MKLEEAISILKQHNLVRHGKMCSKPTGKELTEALETAINLMQNLLKKQE